jgi:hypothetical protein
VAAADYDLTRRVRLVVIPRINMPGGGGGIGDDDVESFALFAIPMLPFFCGSGVSAGLRFGGRFGLMMDFDFMIGRIGEDSDDWRGCSLRERAVQAAWYFPLGESGRRDEIVVGLRYVFDAELDDSWKDPGWSDGSGFGLDLAYCMRVYRPFSMRAGLRHDWLKFGELRESSVTYSVSDRTDVVHIYVSLELRF